MNGMRNSMKRQVGMMIVVLIVVLVVIMQSSDARRRRRRFHHPPKHDDPDPPHHPDPKHDRPLPGLEDPNYPPSIVSLGYDEVCYKKCVKSRCRTMRHPKKLSECLAKCMALRRDVSDHLDDIYN
ncbi:hypothetical protein CJ030_MR8G020218 [Morella rubra]|uniref:Uncharacterized protein n=1 Tax=Morella rubra TaxID=262757 RepID=A0A6A1USU6_9ROSI|nr:hypothetical protein CJ030_MR8G020218 [Morella rubra]